MLKRVVYLSERDAPPQDLLTALVDRAVDQLQAWRKIATSKTAIDCHFHSPEQQQFVELLSTAVRKNGNCRLLFGGRMRDARQIAPAISELVDSDGNLH